MLSGGGDAKPVTRATGSCGGPRALRRDNWVTLVWPTESGARSVRRFLQDGEGKERRGSAGGDERSQSFASAQRLTAHVATQDDEEPQRSSGNEGRGPNEGRDSARAAMMSL